jgi:hypothetical protein
MPVDALVTTKLMAGAFATASATAIDLTSGAASVTDPCDLGVGGLQRLMFVRVLVIEQYETSGGGTMTWTVEHCKSTTTADFRTLAGTLNGKDDVTTLSSTHVSKEFFIPIYTPLQYIRVACTVGTTPVGGKLKCHLSLVESVP